MGILNVTPDSFSDGGAHFSTQQAIEHGIGLVDQGAEILDIGGESTRPYATPVSPAEEESRVVPVIRGVLAARPQAIVSIDTSKPAVAEAALALGAEIVNDVTGLADPQMIDLARTTGAGVCVMHMQGTPQTMQDSPAYSDVVAEIYEYLRQRRDALARENAMHSLAALGSMYKIGAVQGEGAVVQNFNAILDALNATTLDRFHRRDFSPVFERYIHN